MHRSLHTTVAHTVEQWTRSPWIPAHNGERAAEFEGPARALLGHIHQQPRPHPAAIADIAVQRIHEGALRHIQRIAYVVGAMAPQRRSILEPARLLGAGPGQHD